MTHRYLNASEIKNFAYCQRSWFLERQEVPTESLEARERGTADHQVRAQTVQAYSANTTQATRLSD